MLVWPPTAVALIQTQWALGQATPDRWSGPMGDLRVGACFACFADAAGAGASQSGAELGWAAAAVTRGRRLLAVATSSGPVTSPYVPALLALREGPLLEQAARALAV